MLGSRSVSSLCTGTTMSTAGDRAVGGADPSTAGALMTTTLGRADGTRLRDHWGTPVKNGNIRGRRRGRCAGDPAHRPRAELFRRTRQAVSLPRVTVAVFVAPPRT